MSLEYIDISPVISGKTAVFPGDVSFAREESLGFEKGDHLCLSSVSTTLHIGAHADAPKHYHSLGESIAQRDLGPYLGKCQVIHVKTRKGDRIQLADILNVNIQAPRVLFRTDSFLNPNHWESKFTSLSPEVITFLARQGVRLVGIDSPSVDPFDSKELPSHQALFEEDVSVLEGLVLSHVTAGVYTLVALPLRIEDADASPVRAILLPESGEKCAFG